MQKNDHVYREMPSGVLRLLRKRNFGHITIIGVLLLSIILLIVYNNSLNKQLSEIQLRLEHSETIHQAQQAEVILLAEHIKLQKQLSTINESSATEDLMESLNNKTTYLLLNMPKVAPTFKKFKKPLTNRSSIRPLMINNPNCMKPKFVLSKGRSGVLMAFGIPTVKRNKKNYLLITLQSVIDGMTESEANDSVIIIFIGETDMDFVHYVVGNIEQRFPQQIATGQLEIVSPQSSYYPDFEMLKITLNDSIERAKWRTKQNLDFAYLMAYAQSKATFYVHIDDDVLVSKGFFSIMKNFALEMTNVKKSWFLLDFGLQGTRGKLLRSVELPWLITFFQMFCENKPADWLLEDFVSLKFCVYSKKLEAYEVSMNEVWIPYKISLFLHIGEFSTLHGKFYRNVPKEPDHFR